MNRLPVNPLIMRGLQLAEEERGLAPLAERLGVAPAAIDDWRFGLATMPEDKFLQLVDVLSGIDPSWRRIHPSAVAAAASKRIVVVDDNADAAITLAHLLELLGHQATAVIDARNAIAIAAELQPHLAIVDINMPYVNGLQLARLFREDARLKDVRLVALTAMDDAKYRGMTRQAGFDAHLRKPADAAMLRALIEQLDESGRGGES